MNDEEIKRILAAHLIEMRGGYDSPNVRDPISPEEIKELAKYLVAVTQKPPTDAVLFTCAKCGANRWMTKTEHELALAEARLQYTEEQILAHGGIENMPMICSLCYSKIHIKPLEN